MMLGRVDEVDGNFVATRFVALLFPVGSLYVASKVGRTGKSADAMPIRTSWKSIGLAYARVWLPVVALTLVALDLSRGALHVATYLGAVLLIGISAFAHRAGRLSEREKARLRLLGSVTGLRVDPANLTTSFRETKRASLLALMAKAGIPPTVEGIHSVLEDIPAPALPLVYGYVRYAGEAPEWRALAELVYRRHEEAAF